MRCRLLVIFLVMISVAASFAAVPQTINYQGHLASSGGSPLNATVDMTFTINDTAIGGASLWSEAQTVQVNNGIYVVALGAINPIDPAIIDGDLWLGVKVGADAEMAPRQKLRSVPFAMNANRATELAAGDSRDALCALYANDNKPDFCPTSNAISHIDNGNDTVSDVDNDLMWQKSTTQIDTMPYYQNAVLACTGETTGGFSDWRIPVYSELSSLRNHLYFNPIIAPVFNTLAGKYWSSTETLETGGRQVFDFFNDKQSEITSTTSGQTYPFRCVRNISLGEGWADNGNSTVSHVPSGLMWHKNTSVVNTLSYYSNAATTCVTSTTGGWDDWYMPSIDQLQTLRDLRYANPVTSSLFQVNSGYYLSSSTEVGSTNRYGVDFYNDYTRPRNVSNSGQTYNFRCVRN